MTNIDFYFDPSCPWCWVTSRWLVEVSEERDIHINWFPFSLAIKNDELTGNDTTGHLEPHLKAHKIMRMIEAIYDKEGLNRGDLYTEFGRAYYLDKTIDDEQLIEAVLDRLGLDDSYKDEANNVAHDVALEGHIKTAVEIVGDDVGVPLIVFTSIEGKKQGYFGPVLQGMPDKEEGLELWDGLSKLAESTKFFELKRSRTGGAKPATTSRVFEE